MAAPSVILDSLAPGSRVAIINFLGSLCPVTRSHLGCIVEAGNILRGEASPVNAVTVQPYHVCLASMRCNSDRHVGKKMEEKGVALLDADRRLHLCALAAKGHQTSRLCICAHPRHYHVHVWAEELAACYPALVFDVWTLNGADDVVKYRKWASASEDNRQIAMGRPGDSDAILQAIGAHPNENFVLGPEMPDVSSSAARDALLAGDARVVDQMLDPTVAQWLYAHGPWQPPHQSPHDPTPSVQH